MTHTHLPLFITLLLLAACVDPQTKPSTLRSRTIERDLTKKIEDETVLPTPTPLSVDHKQISSKPDFDIYFKEGNIQPDNPINPQALLKNRSPNKPYLVLISYTFGDQHVDPANTAAERIHAIATAFTLEGFDPANIIPLTAWGTTLTPDIPNDQVLGFFIDRAHLGEFLPIKTLY